MTHAPQRWPADAVSPNPAGAARGRQERRPPAHAPPGPTNQRPACPARRTPGPFFFYPRQLVVCGSPAGVLGLTVCYDLRFPELYQKLTWEMGAQLLLVPSAFTKVTGEGCAVLN